MNLWVVLALAALIGLVLHQVLASALLLALAFGSLFSFELLGAVWLHKRGLWPSEGSSYDFYLLVLKTRFALLVNAAVAIFGTYLVLEMRIESKALILADIVAIGVLPVTYLWVTLKQGVVGVRSAGWSDYDFREDSRFRYWAGLATGEVVWLVACGIFIVLLCRRYTAM